MADENQKRRYWAFLVYPESAPDGWRQTLKDSHGSYAISPLHEPDGEHQKPHYHVIYRHPNTVSQQGALKAIPEGVPANGCIIGVSQPTNYQRYLIHLDDPEKQQWPNGSNEIDILGGFPLDLSREMSKSEQAALRDRLLAMIRDFMITEYSDFVYILMDSGDADGLDYACTHTFLFESVIKSVRHKG